MITLFGLSYGTRTLFIIKHLWLILIFQVDPSWNVFNLLQEKASQVAALDLGLKAGIKDLKSLSPKVLYLLGADDADVLKGNIPSDVFVIYQGQILFGAIIIATLEL